jgi:hypothetical protein
MFQSVERRRIAGVVVLIEWCYAGMSLELGIVTSSKLPSAETGVRSTIHSSRPSLHQSVDKADPRSSLKMGDVCLNYNIYRPPNRLRTHTSLHSSPLLP